MRCCKPSLHCAVTSLLKQVDRDGKLPPLATDCCIVTNSGALCRMQVNRRCWRQTDRQADVVSRHCLKPLSTM